MSTDESCSHGSVWSKLLANDGQYDMVRRMRRSLSVVPILTVVTVGAGAVLIQHPSPDVSLHGDLAAVSKAGFEAAYRNKPGAFVIVEKTRFVPLSGMHVFRTKVGGLGPLQQAFDRANKTPSAPHHFKSAKTIGWFPESHLLKKNSPDWVAWKAAHPEFKAFVQLAKPALSADGKYAITEVFERGGYYEVSWTMLFRRTKNGFTLVEPPMECSAVS